MDLTEFEMEKNNVALRKRKKIRYSYCCVEGCDTNLDEIKTKTFQFPYYNEELNSAWAINCEIDATNTKNRRVCEKHFEKKYIGIKYLKKHSLPTILLNNPKPVLNLSSKKEIRTCIVESCCNTTENSILFQFPIKNLPLCKSWMEACNLDSSVNPIYKYVCENHFKSEENLGIRLKPGAIPCLNLFESSDIIKEEYDVTEQNINTLQDISSVQFSEDFSRIYEPTNIDDNASNKDEDHKESLQKLLLSSTAIKNEPKYTSSDDDFRDFNRCSNSKSLSRKLATWALNFGISTHSLEQLLKILKEEKIDVPVTANELLALNNIAKPFENVIPASPIISGLKEENKNFIAEINNIEKTVIHGQEKPK